MNHNEGFVLLSQGPDTSELACDAVRKWWARLGWRRYWSAGGLRVLCDCGGSNGNRQLWFKEVLAELATELRRLAVHGMQGSGTNV